MYAETLRLTPTWVWLLLFFLIYRGVNALRPRQTSLWRTLLVPVIFLIWGVASLQASVQQQLPAYLAFLTFLVVGTLVGWRLWPRHLIATYDAETRQIARCGSPIPLILIGFAFLSKYILAATLANEPVLASTHAFAVLSGSINGLADGLFWGITLHQLWPLRQQILL